jgi:hypothetical protein
MVFEHFEKHLGEAIDRIGRKALGVGKMPDGIKSPKDIRGTIDQKESGSIRHINKKHQIPSTK